MRISWQFPILCAVLLSAAAAAEPPRSARIVTSSDELDGPVPRVECATRQADRGWVVRFADDLRRAL